MATTFQDNITFAGDVSIAGTLTATGIPTLNGATLTINADAAAGTDQDPALAMKGGDGGTEIIVTTFGQDSSADKAYIKMQGGAAGTTEKSMTLHVGALATTAAVNSTLVLEAGASSTNKPASLVNTGSTGVLAITGTTGVTVSDSVATLSLNAGALTENALASVDLSPSGSVSIAAGTTAQMSGTTVSLSGTTAVSAIVPDNTANAFRVLEGANEYVKVTTTNSSEAITLGNATTNPAITTLGTGQITLAGNVNATGGLDVTGAALTVASQAITQTGSGQVDFVGNVDASAGVDIDADSQALTVGASADFSLLHNGTDTLVTNTTGNLRFDNQAVTGKVQIDLGTDDGNTAFEVRNNSGAVLASMTGAGVSTGFGSTVYSQSLELIAMRAFGSTNTNVLRTATADQRATGTGCFVSTDSATLGRYVTASRNIEMTVSCRFNITGGNLIIRSGAPGGGVPDNSIAPDALEKDRNAGTGGATAVGMCSTFYMASGEVCWVSADATPNNPSTFENRVIFSARSV